MAYFGGAVVSSCTFMFCHVFDREVHGRLFLVNRVKDHHCGFRELCTFSESRAGRRRRDDSW